MDGEAALQVDEQGPPSIAGNALGDQPTLVDRLGFKPYVEAIVRFLTSEATQPPITISVEGDWGSGKSSFLLQLEKAMGGARTRRPFYDHLPNWLGGTAGVIAARAPATKAALTVRFNAWRHDKQDALWAAFALAFVKSLRSEVGLIRAWRGDISLFLKRLKGPRAWLELVLLVVSVLALLIGAIKLYGFVRAHPADAKQLFDWLVRPEPKPDGKSGLASAVMPESAQIWQLASGGTFGTLVALGVAGLFKFRSYIKMPLSLKLEKYISKPDYEGHAAFIENFHLDLDRLVAAYAGKQRVFIFIDDLDRCDVPRAADLMQAINLMIGDSKNLVFIIGMDREKVAAGIAQKYKDILPFLRESAQWKPNGEKDTYSPLYFGYSYLEKFIQISFSLPIAGDETALDAFLREEPREPPWPNWPDRIWSYWRIKYALMRRTKSEEDPSDFVTPPIQNQSLPSVVQEDRIYNRLKVESDSERIRKIVKMVSVLFDYNPRRIKQFTNTFRLALYIASDQGLFDQYDKLGTVTTPEQIGKFVALLLRFPDLHMALELDKRLLETLQELAFKIASDRNGNYHWLEKPGTITLLTHGCEQGTTSGKYSLAEFDVNRLFSVLPRAAPPPVPEASFDFEDLAGRYEAIRAAERGSQKRTRKMSVLAMEAIAEAKKLSSPLQALSRLSSIDRPGTRLMQILIASEHKDAINLPWLIEMNRQFGSPFEHYWCIKTLIDYVPLMSATDRAQINVGLEERWDDIKSDPGRSHIARDLLDLTSDPTPQPEDLSSAARSKAAAVSSSEEKQTQVWPSS